MAATTEISVQ